MKQIIVNEFGGPEKLILNEAPMPSASDGQIVIMENRKTTGKTVLIP